MLLIVPVLAALFAQSSLPLFGLAITVIMVGRGEVLRLVKASDNRSFVALMLDGAVIGGCYELQKAGGPLERSQAAMLLGAWTVFGILSTWLCCRPNGTPFFGHFATCWLSGPLAALILTHNSPPGPGRFYFDTPTLLALVPIWAGDTAAIFAGRAFGKHPMAPKISPKKTWEGGAANLLACLAAAALVAALIGKPWQIGLACGLAAGTLGQAGDLFESYVKRQAGVKDSGTLLPGHGGLMDRIDSILFTAPAVALILTFA